MSSRKTWRTRRRSGRFSRCDGLGTRGVPGMLPGVILPVGALGTRGVSGECSGWSSGWGHLGHVAYPESTQGIYRLGSLVTRGVSGECPGYLPVGVTRDKWRWISNGGLGFDRGLQTGANWSGDSGRRIWDQRRGFDRRSSDRGELARAG